MMFRITSELPPSIELAFDRNQPLVWPRSCGSKLSPDHPRPWDPIIETAMSLRRIFCSVPYSLNKDDMNVGALLFVASSAARKLIGCLIHIEGRYFGAKIIVSYSFALSPDILHRCFIQRGDFLSRSADATD